ncbi:MAG TPA: putative DNA modification/repair radical SAM protein [Peptococcaceae bacterium]|nr:putative DNA modification/repair radical SAM protein [Peptococcaceae bacterium]
MNTLEKLLILADGAKYDVSCASSGVNKSNKGGLGNAKAYGICHTWSADGRCISLLKILLTNYCIYNCAYCVNRNQNDIPRASFTPREVAELTIQFYRRNYIEGLFLSSAVERNPNHTMEKIYQTLAILRNEFHFHGYIHVKVIPGADPALIQKIGHLADRMSVNIEQPSEESLKLLAPQKSMQALLLPMKQISQQIMVNSAERKISRHVPKFVPGGQSTQMIIGASNDSDLAILKTTETLYEKFHLKRVYYSAYVPVNEGPNLPALSSAPPLLREHRLYQADWLLRYYKFKADEIVSRDFPKLETDVDPKIAWALRNIHFFPKEINKASYEELLRIPGIGVTSALRIIRQRRLAPVSYDHLGKMGVVLKRAKYFITCQGRYYGGIPIDAHLIRRALVSPEPHAIQLTLF